MAERTANPNPPDATPPAAPVAAKPSLFSTLKVLGFVGAVVGAECLVANMYLPSAAETAAMAEATLPVHQKTAAPRADEAGEENTATAEQAEVDLGQFSVTAFQPSSGSTLRIEVRLYGVVDAKDEKEFLRLKEENRHRFRDQVITTIRSAEMGDLTDAGLGLLKRRILEKTHRLFGKPLLRNVIFSDFSTIEQ